jgi:hypothetical protein
MDTSSIMSVSDKTVTVFGQPFDVDEQGYARISLQACQQLSQSIERWSLKMDQVLERVQTLDTTVTKLTYEMNCAAENLI